MHILSKNNRDEFLAVPQLIRFDYVPGLENREPTLLVKGNTLLLKYIVLGARMQLAFTICAGKLLYALRVFDDEDNAGTLWSIAETQKELDAINAIVDREPMVLFLFNEIAVNVAWNNAAILDTKSLETTIKSVTLSDRLDKSLRSTARNLLNKIDQSDDGRADWLLVEIGDVGEWKPVKNHFIRAAASSSLIDLFDRDEGSQQEQVGIWLTDSLLPLGVYHSPQRPYKNNQTRELTDIMLSYEHGAILIESKTLSLFSRHQLPKRTKLKGNVSSHITKAFKQLRGGIRKLKEGVEITDLSGNNLSVSRDKPDHAIVLIPDLDLIDNRLDYGPDFIEEFMTKTGGFPHLLDISELLRLVQVAEMHAKRSATITPMMAFDYYLMERVKHAIDAESLCVEVLHHFVDS